MDILSLHIFFSAEEIVRQIWKIGPAVARLRVHWPNIVPYMGIHWANFSGLSGEWHFLYFVESLSYRGDISSASAICRHLRCCLTIWYIARHIYGTYFLVAYPVAFHIARRHRTARIVECTHQLTFQNFCDIFSPSKKTVRG